MNEALENKMILNAYRGVLRSIKSRRSKEETKIIRKALAGDENGEEIDGGSEEI